MTPELRALLCQPQHRLGLKNCAWQWMKFGAEICPRLVGDSQRGESGTKVSASLPIPNS